MSGRASQNKRSAPSAGGENKKPRLSNDRGSTAGVKGHSGRGGGRGSGKPSYPRDSSKSFGGRGKPGGGGASSYSYSKPSNSSTGRTGGNAGGNSGRAGQYKGKARADADDVPAKRRKQPVTRGGGEVEDDASEIDETGEDAIDDLMQGDGDADDDEVGYADPNKVVINEAAGTGEKRPRMNKDERAALHAAQPHRTTLLPSHGLLVSLMPIWERARKVEVPKHERVAAVKELWEAVKGRVGEISKGHKGGRILQTIVKYGGKEERLGVAQELRPQWRAMMESKYSKFLMSKLIRYCPSIRPQLIADLRPALPHLLAHAEAVQPLSDFFDLYATAKEKRQLVKGFYPKEVVVFDTGKDGEQGLEDILAGIGEGGAGRARVLGGIEKNVLGPFNATQKTALAQAIFHRLVHEYLICIYRFLEPEEADKKMHDLLTASLESLPEIVHTKDGSAVVRLLLVRGNAKDRKQILQQLRKHIPAMAKDADAQMVLFTAFDCVDDTKLMGKAFVADLVALTTEIASDKNGRRALLNLLTPTSTKHFLPDTVKDLAESSKMARELGTSKKDQDVRRKELRGYASEGLLKSIADHGEEMVRDPGSGLVVQEIMLYTTGDKTAAVQALVEPLRSPFPDLTPGEEAESSETQHLLGLSHCVRTYKTLLSGGHFDTASNSVKVLDSALPGLMSAALLDAVVSEDAGGEANLVRIATAAPFVVVELLAALPQSKAGQGQVKAILGSKAAKEAIGFSEAKGAALLLERIAAL